MSCLNSRLWRLEASQRRKAPTDHVISVLIYPRDLLHTDRERWLREEVTCACGTRGCLEMRVGALLPEKAPSAEAWAERAQQYYAPRPVTHA